MFTVKNNGLEYAINNIKSSEISSSISDIPELNLVVVNRENNPSYQFLNEEAVLVVEGQEWRIKVENERPNYKALTALHTFIDLQQENLDVYYETRTVSLSTALGEVLNGTGFTYNLVDTDYNITLNKFGRCSKWDAFKDIIKQAETEYIIKDKNVTVGKEIAVDNGRQFRYAYNLKNIGKTTDSSDIVTHVVVYYGKDLTQKSTFISPTAGSYDRAYYGDTIEDERIENVETARSRAKEEFRDIKLSYDLNVSSHDNVYSLGEIVYTIYEPFDNLSITTRIRNIKEKWNGERFLLDSITVGNYVFQTADEMIHDQIQDEKNRTDEEIDKVKNGLRIAFEDSIAYTDAELGEVVTNFNSELTLTAQQLRTEFEAETTAINGDITILQNDVSSVTQTAQSLQSTVSSQQLVINNQGSRLTNAESRITQNANNIELKVSTSDYTGSNIISRINLDSSSATIQADKINLIGAVTVLSDITGNMGTITSGNINITQDIRVGNNIYLGTSSTATKNLVLNGQAIISGTSAGRVTISSTNLDLDDQTGINIGNIGTSTLVRGYLELPSSNNRGYVATTNNNLGLAYSSSTNRLYVRISGSDVGFVQLT